MSSVRAKKSLGQHFLADGNIARKIVATLEAADYRQVLEIGPGMGVLTRLLLERDDMDLSCIEVDSESVSYLRRELDIEAGRVIEGDFLKLPLEELAENQLGLIGNLPYNISSQIFFRMLGYQAQVREAVFMVQHEVAQRIASPHGTKNYGILSVLLQNAYDIKLLFKVGPGVFRPPPKVQSAVLRLTRKTGQPEAKDKAYYTKVVKTAFNQRRKTLRNSLKSICAPESLPENYASMRPEQLSPEDFITLADQLVQKRT